MASAQLNTPTAEDGSEFPILVIAYGFGRSDGVEYNTRLTVKRTQANLALFKDYPSILKESKTKTQQSIRTQAGVFQFLAFKPPNGDAIWNKWMRVSNWIDLTCYVFDEQYPWNQNAYDGEPRAPPGQTASLRALYAYFIDNHLAKLEDNQARWAADASRVYQARHPATAEQKKDRAWIDSAFGPNGWATASKMRFPRQAHAVGGSVYGAYGNAQMTLDGSNQSPRPAIGMPTKIQ
ncbi:glycosyl hydrolase family 18 protein [Rutstroemia sp. NJR-2017a BBW]|nr:glycosyl hydrolase family 18 protein [Rutstroemia sp. NJR-2017a BBW]